MCAWHRGRPIGTLYDTRIRTRPGPQCPIPSLGKGSCPLLPLEGRGTRSQAGSALSRVQVPVCSHAIHGQDGMEAAQLAPQKLVFRVVGTGVILSQEAACGKLRAAILYEINGFPGFQYKHVCCVCRALFDVTMSPPSLTSQTPLCLSPCPANLCLPQCAVWVMGCDFSSFPGV